VVFILKNYIEETLLIISLTFMGLYLYGKICEAKGFRYVEVSLFIFPFVLLCTLFFIILEKNQK